MTQQQFYEFQTNVDGAVLSYVNLPDGGTILRCEDGQLLIVEADGDSTTISADDAGKRGYGK